MTASGADLTPYIVVANAAVVGIGLTLAGRYLASAGLTAGTPGKRQNLGEYAVAYFLGKARGMIDGPERARVIRIVTPLLGTFFLFILFSNAFGMLPIPLVNRPPTSYFGVTLALALCSVGATFALSIVFRGGIGALKHLIWPNPLQWVSELTDVLSLSLRLFGNIGGEYLTFYYVSLYVPYGIPVILHVFGLIPVFVQALVFTLLTASFMESAIGVAASRAGRKDAGSRAVDPGGASRRYSEQGAAAPWTAQR